MRDQKGGNVVTPLEMLFFLCFCVVYWLFLGGCMIIGSEIGRWLAYRDVDYAIKAHLSPKKNPCYFCNQIGIGSKCLSCKKLEEGSA